MAYNPYMFFPQETLNQFKYPQQSPIVWVQGEAGAKAYIVAPNSTAILWDSERNTIYVKSADMSGIPSIKILDFTERGSVEEVAETNILADINEKIDFVYRKLKGDTDE